MSLSSLILSNSNSQGRLGLLSEGFNLHQLFFTNSLMVVAINRMEGLALLEHIETHPESSHTDNAIACGYVREDGKVAYTDYYEAILEAKQTHQGYTLNHNDADDDCEFQAWYESLNEETTELWDAVYERVPEECDIWDVQQCKDFISHLDDLGINSASNFEDAFLTYDSGYDVEARFAEDYYSGCGYIDSDHPLYFAIDWDIVWRHNLEYDINTFEFNGETWFFNNTY
jgi:hypothetical protein